MSFFSGRNHLRSARWRRPGAPWSPAAGAMLDQAIRRGVNPTYRRAMSAIAEGGCSLSPLSARSERCFLVSAEDLISSRSSWEEQGCRSPDVVWRRWWSHTNASIQRAHTGILTPWNPNSSFFHLHRPNMDPRLFTWWHTCCMHSHLLLASNQGAQPWQHAAFLAFSCDAWQLVKWQVLLQAMQSYLACF